MIMALIIYIIIITDLISVITNTNIMTMITMIIGTNHDANTYDYRSDFNNKEINVIIIIMQLILQQWRQ